MSTCTLDRIVTGAVPVQPAALAELASLVALSRLPLAPLRRQAPDAAVALLEAELRLALADASTGRAYDAARALWRRTGDLHRCQAVLARARDRQGRPCPVAAQVADRLGAERVSQDAPSARR